MEQRKSLLNKNSIILLFFVLATALGWFRMIGEADKLGYHEDELVAGTEAAVNFFRHFDYTSAHYPQPFDPELSTGLYATWPTGLLWFFNPTLLTQRILLGFLCWIQVLFLTSVFFTKITRDRVLGLTAGSLVWLYVMRLPMWQTFLFNLGELPGAICLLWSLYFLRNKPLVAFLFCGFAVWGCKLIYLPVVAMWGLAYLLSSELPWSQRIKHGMACIAAFVLPLFIWMSFIVIRYDFHALSDWAQHYKNFIIYGPSGIANNPIKNFWERLARLEWATYSVGTKANLLFLLFSPMIIAIVTRFGRSFSSSTITKQEKALFLSNLVVLIYFSTWWFFRHHGMWARHLQPALFVGLGSILFWTSVLVQNFSNSRRAFAARFILFLVPLLVLAEGASFVKRLSLLQSGLSYARACRGDVTNKTCSPEHDRWAHQMRNL